MDTITGDENYVIVNRQAGLNCYTDQRFSDCCISWLDGHFVRTIILTR
jgi:hypothetical protein